MAGEVKVGAGRPARTRAAESQVTDDASRGQPKRRPEAEPLPLPVTKPVRGLMVTTAINKSFAKVIACQLVLQGVDCQLGAVPQLQFLQQVRNMSFYCPLTDE